MAATVPAVGPDGKPLAVIAAEQAMANPETREMMRQQGLLVGGYVSQQAYQQAAHWGGRTVSAFQEYIQQGPKGISMLCFFGGLATSVCGVLMITNVVGSVANPINYILNAYLLAFGCATFVLETDTDRVGMMPTPFDRLAGPLTSAQAWLHQEVRLLTELRGRGLFYFYQGTLMVTQCVLCPLFLAGIYNGLMGVLCISMSFGLKPDIEGMVSQTTVMAGQQYVSVPDKVEDSTMVTRPAAAPPVVDPVTQKFPKALAAWKASKERLTGKANRALWALSNQATVGDCDQPKPHGMFNGNAKEEWRLWNDLRGIDPYEAKFMFMERLRREKIDY